MTVNTKVKAVFFDIDNTLFNSARLTKMARINAVRAMIECGLPLTDVMEGYNLLMKIVRKYGSNYGHHFDRLLEILGCKWDAKIVAAGIVAYHDTKLAYLKPEPDVVPTLIELRERGYKLGVISNGKSVKQWEKIIRLRLHHFFHTVVISEDVGSEKPDVKIFQAALNQLGLKPNETLYVGDCPETDILGANKAGLISVRVIRENQKAERSLSEDLRPKYTIGNLRELLEILSENQLRSKDPK